MLKILVLNKMPEIVLLKLFKSNEWQYCAIYFLQKKMWACTEKKEDESFIHISPFNLELLLKVEFIDKWILKTINFPSKHFSSSSEF